jgi:AraC-like DNA-binding protein
MRRLIWVVDTVVRRWFICADKSRRCLMRSAYEFLKFSWLAEEDVTNFQPWHGDIDVHPYPLVPEVGECGIAKLELAFGMTLFRATHRFGPEAPGQLIHMAEVEGSFPAESLMVQVVNAGLIVHREEYPAAEVIFRPGQDLFRLADRLKLVPLVDGSSDSIMTALTVSRTALGHLIGDNIAEATLNALGLTPAPKVVVRSMPTSVSAHLHDAIPQNLDGAARRLICQSRALEYLSALIEHLGTNAADKTRVSAGRARARELHEQLTTMQGKLPTLEELAIQFKLSARTLNDEFKSEYGQPIHAFITERRLVEAHAAIEQTGIPLKSVAQHLGYIHTNHFLTAFRRKFGYSPGSLRKNRK